MLNIAAPKVDQVVQDILDSYKLLGAINHIGGPNLPSRQRSIDIWHALRSLLFPGYYEREPVDEESLFYLTGERVSWVRKNLADQVHRSQCQDCGEQGGWRANKACR